MLLFTSTYSQKTIETPDYGLSSIPGSIAKIELTETATILHFHLKMSPGTSFSVPKTSFIQDVKGDTKLYVLKGEGVPINKSHKVSSSGEINYQLYFPKLASTVNTIDFGENNEGGNWAVYDMIINKEAIASVLPTKLQGNWLRTDGSNIWDYGFYPKQAILEKTIWNYKSVEKKRNKYTITLIKDGIEKTIYASLSKKGIVKIGSNKKELSAYETNTTSNLNYKLINDTAFSSSVFKLASTTYSGVIKGYTTRAGLKTGSIHVSNVLTGNQDTHVMKISENGSFSVKFPLIQSQTIFVRTPAGSFQAYVEPGKETFHFISSNKDQALFMGDCARINTDLKELQSINYFNHSEVSKQILGMSPAAYKKYCKNIYTKELKAIEDLSKKKFLSVKSLQIARLNSEYGMYGNILSYKMNLDRAKRKSKSKPSKSPEIEASYYDFISPSVLNNKLAVLSSRYATFINRLTFSETFRSKTRLQLTTLEKVDVLKKYGIILSNEELKMADASKEIQSAEIFKKQQNFDLKVMSEARLFIKNHMDIFRGLKKKSTSLQEAVINLSEGLTEKSIALSSEEEELYLSVKNFKSKEFIEKENTFYKNYGSAFKNFNSKHANTLNAYMTEKRSTIRASKMKEVFGISESFIFDVISVQDKTRRLISDFNPYTADKLKEVQKQINNPFLANYIAYQNEQTKAKIEANKRKTGFTVHSINKTEGDELFDSMISKFKGKVIYVDFWATWCAPCKSGIRKIASLKEEMKNEDVVFLYVTNQTSPESTWKNSIPDIKGEHFRVSQDEWNYLSQKFNISGIPHYTLVNKKGEIVRAKMRHRDNKSLKKTLEKQIN